MFGNEISNQAPPSIILDAEFLLFGKKFNMEAVAPLVNLAVKLNLNTLILGTKHQKKHIIKTLSLMDIPVQHILEEDLEALFRLPDYKFYVRSPNLHSKYRESILKEDLVEVYKSEILKG